MKQFITPITKFVKDYVSQAKARGVVLGMSGGKDSYVAAALCARALGSKNVLGVIMPNSAMEHQATAVHECESLGIDFCEIDISSPYNFIMQSAEKVLNKRNASLSSISTTNTPPRLRMTTLYALAGSLNYLVVNTSNLSEAMVGYTTKWGDNVGDIAPLLGLTKTEVCQLGLALGLEEKLVMQQPSDGLSGKTDEDNLGFTYSELDALIRRKEKGPNFEKIMRRHNQTAHKRGQMSYFDSKLKNYLEGE